MKKMEFDADVKQLNAVNAFIDAELEAAGCPMRVQMQIDLTVEEIFVNIAHYAYEDKCGKAEITVELLMDPAGIHIEFRDAGVPYDPLSHKDPDVTLTAEERRIGGLGIYLVKQQMDHLTYQRDGEENLLTIEKYFD